MEMLHIWAKNVSKVGEIALGAYKEGVRDAHCDGAKLEITAFRAPYDPLYGEMGTPPIITDF